MTNIKPEFLELTRRKISETGGYEKQSSSLAFLPASSREKTPLSPIYPELARFYESSSDYEALILMLGHENCEVRIAAAEALGTIGDPRAIEPLFRTCMDDQIEVKVAARDALASIIIKMH